MTQPWGGSMAPAGAPSGARHHHNQHHPIFGYSMSPPGGGSAVKSHHHHSHHHHNHQVSPGTQKVVKSRHQEAAPKIVVPKGAAIQGGVRVKWGHCSEQGRRPTMEDTFIAQDGLGLYAVCDGHSGRHVADILKNLLPSTVRDMDLGGLGGSPVEFHKELFSSVDRAIYRATRGRDGGAAVVTAIIKRGNLYIANLGDCRAVLSEDNAHRAVGLTVDHKPTDPNEAARVEAAGGFIAFGRVGGCLAVSRAFGDFDLKGGERVLMPGLPLPVSNIPEVTQVTLTDNVNFLILACDGVWDVMSNQEAVTVCAQHMSSGAEAMSQALTSAALSRGSMDNVTSLILVFEKGLIGGVRGSGGVEPTHPPRFAASVGRASSGNNLVHQNQHKVGGLAAFAQGGMASSAPHPRMRRPY